MLNEAKERRSFKLNKPIYEFLGSSINVRSVECSSHLDNETVEYKHFA